jgi:hypothetical protein
LGWILAKWVNFWAFWCTHPRLTDAGLEAQPPMGWKYVALIFIGGLLVDIMS